MEYTLITMLSADKKRGPDFFFLVPNDRVTPDLAALLDGVNGRHFDDDEDDEATIEQFDQLRAFLRDAADCVVRRRVDLRPGECITRVCSAWYKN